MTGLVIYGFMTIILQIEIKRHGLKSLAKICLCNIFITFLYICYFSRYSTPAVIYKKHYKWIWLKSVEKNMEIIIAISYKKYKTNSFFIQLI